MNQFFRTLYYDVKYFMEELYIKIKHPTRNCELSYYFSKIWRHCVGHPCYCLKRGIRNLWVWFPTIWKIDVYDHNYLLTMIDKQLSEMETYWKSDAPHVMCKNQTAKRIAWTRKLYKLANDDHYTMIDYEFRKQKFGESDWKSEPCKYDEFGIPVLFTLVDTRSPEEIEHYRTHMKNSHDMDEKLWKLYFKNLARCRGWWD